MKRTLFFMVFVAAAVMLFPQCGQVCKDKKAKYVFYFIGDGMGVNQVNGTEMYLAEREGRIGVKPLGFTQFPVVNFATTYSRYNSVTCSAAAGTALATGSKTKNGTIGMDSLQQVPLYSVAVKAKEAGKRVGITTSVSVDHATPSAFYAHQPSRTMYYEIGTDLPKTGFDFYAGAGFLQPKSKKDTAAPELYGVIESAGYKILRGNEAFEKEYAGTEKAVFIQGEGTAKECLPYAIDRKEGDLSLAQVTENAIRFLTQGKNDGFFLMVEGGKIDWACHSNDAATIFREVVDMDEAIGKALEFYRQHPDETLIVVTADHETGGIVLGTGKYALNLQALQHQKLSKEELTHKIQALRAAKGNKVTWEEVRGLLGENLGFWKGVKLNEQQEQQLKEVYKRTFGKGGVKMEKDLYAENELLAAEAIRMLAAVANVGWVSSNHSAGVVPVYAIGAGSRLFSGKLDNTDIPKKIAEAAGY